MANTELMDTEDELKFYQDVHAKRLSQEFHLRSILSPKEVEIAGICGKNR